MSAARVNGSDANSKRACFTHTSSLIPHAFCMKDDIVKTLTPQLPTVLGSFSAMLIAFLSLINGTSPGTCLMKAFSAFLVFAGLGLILRHALTIEEDDKEKQTGANDASGMNNGMGNLDMIVPGTSVADLLASHTPDNARQAAEV